MVHIISVVTPSLNQAEYLKETILSVLSQQGDFLIDYVIVDGASTDGSVEIIASYERELQKKCRIERINGADYYVSDKPIHINRCKGISYRWVSEPDKGHGDALNKGFSQTFGNIMCWLNSDDVFLNDAFSTIADIYSQFDHVKWTTALNVIIRKDGSRAPITHLGKFNYKNVYSFLTNDYEFIQQEATFWRRELWEKAGGNINTDYKLMVDGELWCRYFIYENLYHINREIGAYRLHDSNRAHKFMQEVRAEMKKAVLALEQKVPSHIRDIARNITENAPGTVENCDELNFKVIDKVTGQSQWIIRDVNFFTYSSKRHAYKMQTILQEYEDVDKRFQSETTKLKNSITDKENIIKQNIESLKKKEAEKWQLNEDLKTSQFKLNEAKDSIRQLEATVRVKDVELKGNIELIAQLKTRIDDYTHKIRNLEESLLEQEKVVAALQEARESLIEKSTIIDLQQKQLNDNDATITELLGINTKLREAVAEKSTLIGSQQELIAEKDNFINEQLNQNASLRDLLDKNIMEAREHQAVLQGINQTVSMLNERIQLKENELESLKIAVENKDLLVSNLQSELNQLHYQINYFKSALAENKQLIRQIENSYSFRLGRALLYPAKQIRNIFKG